MSCWQSRGVGNGRLELVVGDVVGLLDVTEGVDELKLVVDKAVAVLEVGGGIEEPVTMQEQAEEIRAATPEH